MRKVNCNGTLFHDEINSLSLSVYLKANQNVQQICFWLGGKLLERSSVTCEGNTDRELDHYLLKVKVHLPGDLEFSFSIPTLESSWHAHKQQTHSLFFWEIVNDLNIYLYEMAQQPKSAAVVLKNARAHGTQHRRHLGTC